MFPIFIFCVRIGAAAHSTFENTKGNRINLSINFVLLFIPVDKSSNYDAKKVHLDNLFRMVQYCENRVDCRRGQQLEYFGENFDKNQCGKMARAVCDNCSSGVC